MDKVYFVMQYILFDACLYPIYNVLIEFFFTSFLIFFFKSFTVFKFYCILIRYATRSDWNLFYLQYLFNQTAHSFPRHPDQNNYTEILLIIILFVLLAQASYILFLFCVWGCGLF